jgi:7-cyano-7-deazaguanine synthase
MTDHTTPAPTSDPDAPPPKRPIVLLSGGISSTAALALSAACGERPLVLAIDYGQPERRSLRAARGIAEHYGLDWQLLELLTWGQAAAGPDGYARNVFPTLLMAATGIALAHDRDVVLTGSRSPRDAAARHLLAHLAGDGVLLRAPFAHQSAAEVLTVALTWDAPLHLAWSCIYDDPTPCGECTGCVERRRAFAVAEVTDPQKVAL